MSTPVILSYQGFPGDTYRCVVEDVARGFEYFGVPMTYGNNTIVAMLITCETRDIRFTFGTSQSPTTVIGHRLDAGNQLRIVHPRLCRYMKVINRTAGQTAVLHVTPEYNE